MRKLLIVLFVIIIGAVGTYVWAQTESGTTYTATGFLKRETTSGMYKTCYYDCLGSEVAISIKSIKLCPLTINCPQ
jgi:hypothetical protein